jgi:medium-chain acyl-[acyl-carrier-protein] hydrolase
MRRSPGPAWIAFRQPRPQARARLFCFPYSGGGANLFRGWPAAFPATIEVCPVELPGRGQRIMEPTFKRLLPLVRAAVEGLIDLTDDRPFAFFGHSLGALIGFELARELRRAKRPGPVHLFLSGRTPPQAAAPRRLLHMLPDTELLGELRRLGGTQEEALQNAELTAMLLPIIRSDFEVYETYCPSDEPPLDCPITVFGGLEDSLTSAQALAGWGSHTRAGCSVHMVPGGHFFLHTAQALVLRTVIETLDGAGEPSAPASSAVSNLSGEL